MMCISDTPLVSIIMSVYNSQKTLARALESIVSQTYQNIEIIIVDDASEDCSIDIIREYAAKNSKIKLMQNNNNMGLAWSLNRAIINSKGVYIARMDSDDRSHPARIERQVLFLENNLEVEVLGTASNYVDADHDFVKTVFMPEHHKDCVSILPKTTPFIHPTVVIRRAFFDKVGFYDESLRKAQDYELWSRGARCARYANIPEILLDYTMPNNKPYKTIFQEVRVRTICAYKYNFLLLSLQYTFVGFLLSIIKKT